MLNFGKYAAIAAAGLGLAALAAPSAEACGFVQTFGCGQVSSLGWGHSFGMYRPVTAVRTFAGYRPVTTVRAFAAYRPVTTYRPVLAYRPVTSYRPVYGYALRTIQRPVYGYAAPVRIYRPAVALRVIRPATYAWAAPRIHVYHPAFGAAYGYVARPRIYGAYGCGC
jgi:hypothetical protein